MESNTTVGFVGVGNAGWPMAANLVGAGHAIVVYDIDHDRATRFAAEHGARAVDDLAELAAVDVLFTMVPDGTVVREVLYGPSGLADRLAEGAIVVDTSSSDPEGTRELGTELARRGVILIDSAVSVPEGGAALDARITFMVGADDEKALARVRPLLETMGAHVFHMGPLGAGHATKTLNNYVSAAGLAAALDALMIGYRYGLDPATMLEVLNVSTGRNFSTEQTLKNKSLRREFDTGYSLTLLVKDLRIAAALAERTGFESDLFALVVRDFAAALDDLGGQDLSASLLHWEHRAGFELPASAPTTSRGEPTP